MRRASEVHPVALVLRLFEHCADAVFAVTLSSHAVVEANAPLEELTGRARGSLIGSPLRSVLAGPLGVNRAGFFPDVALERIGGQQAQVDLTVAHLDDPRLGPTALCVARDGRQGRLIQRELAAKHQALLEAHREIADAVSDLEVRNRDLARSSAELSQATRRGLLGELSAGIAHSINNPLAALSSAQRRLRLAIESHGCPELSLGVQRYFERSDEAVARLGQLVEAVRRAQRGGSHAAPPEPVRVMEEVSVALSLFEDRLQDFRVCVLGDEPGSAWATPGDVQHVLWNLLDNALLAQPGGGALGIEVSSCAVARQVIVAVVDLGPGVPEAMLGRLFEPFATSRGPGAGSGLGLSTSRRLARSWGGDVVHVASARGARFELRLPTRSPREWPHA